MHQLQTLQNKRGAKPYYGDQIHQSKEPKKIKLQNKKEKKTKVI